MPLLKGLLSRSRKGEETTYPDGPSTNGGIVEKDDLEKEGSSNEKVRLFRPYTFAVVLIVSIGGMIFGYGMFSVAWNWFHMLT